MMNETLIIFSREWAVTAALAAYLAPAYSRPAAVVHGLAQLVRVLEEQPFAPVVLGLRPHEHVSGLYRLQPLLSDRAVLFVGRCFYWTDYNLPEWLGMERYGFCTWDAMQHPFSRRMELRRFRQFAADTPDNVSWPTPVASAMTEIQILERANRWLYRELSASGLTRYEVRILSLLAGGRKGRLSCQTRSLHKNKGLYKLGMTKRLMDLYRGVKVRPELQAGLPQQAEESVTEHDGLLRQEAGW
ncbi:hypothetical protein LVC43_001535 [Salmonella enterica]|uniref:Uncharacterized protein n=2 Tax=Salmonella enterica TaxID=28901 RepID=A0A5Y9PED4_SALER|nr:MULTISPECIES: hypothetical protein [Enterobacteriaceae]EAB9286860.1 hypothetical protein [Salmonella enterica subsp. enterica serovar Montevideo]EBP3274150.1 hypothetical protein [Salmonella enterica subsp. enterica]EBS2192930.1 hypothetical protein [Salmonella enterica subsp. enterica serovar Thompson]EBS4235245.1 hypothetical protein [Salmonella enterica subsp. enterica serovar Saintpaul]EBV0440750.1 hypothetical protein [Salmonella enterica subsp. enterica serovar Brandenburg]ECF1631378